MRHSLILLTSFTIACFQYASIANSQEGVGSYPSKPVLVIAPIASGGPIDTETRLYSNRMAEILGQPFVVDNKPAAGGSIGGLFVAKAAPDGYTLLSLSTAFTIYPNFYDLPFDLLKDFVPISQLSNRTTVFVVTPNSPIKSFTEYIAFAKANPGKINFGTTGAGSGTHLAGAWMHSATGSTVNYIHYKGTGPLMPDLFAGRIDVTPVGLIVALSAIKAGKVRVLAILNDRRAKSLPGVPTVSEQGIPGYNYANWLGFVAPRATPIAIVNKLSDGFAKVASSPDVVAALERGGGEMVGSTSNQFRQVLNDDLNRWRTLIQDAGIKIER